MSEWNYDMEAAPKDEVLLLTYSSVRPVMAFGVWDDDKYAKKPRPYWRYIWLGAMHSRASQPYAWKRPDPAPLPEVQP